MIVSYNTRDLLRRCLRSIPASTEGLSAEVFVVDNNSPDDSAGMVAAEFPNVRLIANRSNAGFTRANNQAIKLSVGRHVLILNPDTEPEALSLTRLAKYLDSHPEVGAVGPMLLNTDGSLQQNGRCFPTLWREFLGHTNLRRINRSRFDKLLEYGRDDFDREWETDEVSGACMMVRRAVIDQVGMLDEDFFMFYEETEWCWRIKKAGWKVVYLPQARVVHHWMASVKQQSRAMTARLFRSAVVYYQKTGGPADRLGIRCVVAIGLLRNEALHFGVAVKRRLRAVKILR